MEHQNKIIAVAGATGQQGGAVARRLMAEGWPVRALARDPQKPATRALAGAGAEIVPGDMDNPAELRAAFAGAYGVFSVQNFWLPDVGYAGEIRQGKAVADAAKAAGVQHFVYSSVAAADRGMGQKHFESKFLIEQYIQSLGLPYTILRPVAFMENNYWNRETILNGVYPSWGLRPDKTLQIVAVEDIAAFAALALAEPQTYLGQVLELAGDELTESQIAARFSAEIGRPVKVEMPPMSEGAEPTEEQLAMFNFFNGQGYTVDIAALRTIYPDLLDFETWLHQNGWSQGQNGHK